MYEISLDFSSPEGENCQVYSWAIPAHVSGTEDEIENLSESMGETRNQKLLFLNEQGDLSLEATMDSETVGFVVYDNESDVSTYVADYDKALKEATFGVEVFEGNEVVLFEPGFKNYDEADDFGRNFAA